MRRRRCLFGITIRVDGSAGAELTGVERRRRLEGDRDVAVRLPTLIADEILQVSAESFCRQFAISCQLFVIGVVDGDHVVVGGEKDSAAEVLDAVTCLLLERRLYFLRHNTTTEDPRECVADSSLELSFETLHDAHRALLSPRIYDGKMLGK